MIVPTIGRVVLVFRSSAQPSPFPALVSAVHSDRMINVGGFDASGQPFAETSITLVQEGDAEVSGRRAEWMPYQKATAAGAAPTLHATPKAE